MNRKARNLLPVLLPFLLFFLVVILIVNLSSVEGHSGLPVMADAGNASAATVLPATISKHEETTIATTAATQIPTPIDRKSVV